MFVEHRRQGLDQMREAVRRRAALAALVFGVALAIGSAAIFALPPLYRAAATLVVEPGRGEADAPGELAARLDTIGQRVLSREPLLEQARRFGLYPELASRGLADAIVEQMKGDIRVETKSTADPGGRGSLVALTLSYRGRDPATAARVSNGLTSLYLEQDALLRSQRYAGRAELLKGRLAEVKERLEERAAHAPASPAGAATQAGADAAVLERLVGQLRSLREERLRTLERRDTLEKQLAESDPHTALSARLDTMRHELAQRRQKLTGQHPDVRQLEAEIAALESESSALEGASVPEGSARLRLREALSETDDALRGMKIEEERLEAEMAGVHEGRHAAPAAPGRDLPAVQEVYGSLLRRYEDAQLADSAEEALASRLRLLDPAVPPERAAGPPRVRLLLFASLAALAAAVGMAAVAERVDGSFRSLDDLRAFTLVPVLATVPALDTAADRRRRRVRAGALLAGVAMGAVFLGAGTYRAFAQGHWLTAALERSR